MTEGVVPVVVGRRARRFDESRGCFVYDISFKTRSQITDRTIEVARSFGLGIDEEKEHILYRDFELKLADGDVVYITGDSGSGKSALLRALAADLGERAVDISDVEVNPDSPLIDTVGATFQEALTLLSKVGLNDAFLFLRRYPELSDGQRYRYRIAKMVDSGRRFWLADEFCSTLDRTTARVVAYNMQKMARRTGSTLVVTTTHTDLEEDMNPSIVIRKGWGEEIDVDYRPNVEASGCTAVEDVVIREATKGDYLRLSSLHYRDSRLPVPIKIYAAERASELAGVVAYSYPGVNAKGRRLAVGYRPALKELNTDWAVVSRVIVHPKYRSTGLGARLLRDTLPQVGRRHVELIAVMAEYNPFAERAGMKPITVSTPDPTVTRALEELRVLGFSPPLMASRSYNISRLNQLGPEDIEGVREALLRVSPGFFKRIRSSGRAYIGKAEMEGWIREQPPERLARCLQILAVLSQAKAYLYWCRDWGEAA